MPIDTKHPFYLDHEDRWLDCRNCFNGQQAVKDAGTRYLPRLTGQTDAEYEAYKMRALFYSITSKTISALVGMAMDQPPSLKYPDKMASYFKDSNGVQFQECLAATITEILLTGRFGILIDRPVNGGDPYLTIYETESIYNWRTGETGQLEMVVLREKYLEQSASDKFVTEVKYRFREMELVDGQLVVRVHTPADNTGKTFDAGTETTITNAGIPLDFIPFFCVTSTGLGFDPVKSPVQDIVDINLSHYRTSADLEHGRHFTGLPTPWVTGAESQSKMSIGSTTAWVIPEASAKVGFLEFQGLGLASLEKALAEKQSQLASLSARLIDNSTRGSEAAETVKLRYLSETSSLRTVVNVAQSLMNSVFTTVAKMMGLGETEVNITLNTNFLDTKLSAAELKAWVDAYLARGISKEIFIHALKVGRALPPPGEDMGEIPDPPEPTAPKGNQTSNQPAVPKE